MLVIKPSVSFSVMYLSTVSFKIIGLIMATPDKIIVDAAAIKKFNLYRFAKPIRRKKI